MTIGEFLKEKRTSKKQSLRALGEKAGVSNVYVFQVERGLCSPTFDRLARLLKALGVDWLEFLEATGYRKPSKTPAKRKPRGRG